MICKNCGTENLDGALFCKSCGKRVDGKIICPNCNFENEETNTFCSKCGTRIDGKKFCLNCGAEVEGVFCTKCGVKYGTKKLENTNNVSNRNGLTFVSKVLDIVGNSILMLGVILSLIFIFFAGYDFAGEDGVVINGHNIFYYFSKAYEDLKLLYSGESSYSASLEISGYLPTVMTTVVISACLICCVLFAILAIIRFIKKLCFNGEKSPALFSLLSIVFYLICAISLKNIFYYLIGYTEGYNLFLIDIKVVLNGITNIGVIISIICALVYYVIAIINKAITLRKNQIINFVLTNISIVVLIVMAILLSNVFLTFIEEIGDDDIIKCSFTMMSKFLAQVTHKVEMIPAVILSGLTQALSIVGLFMVLFIAAKSLCVEKNNLANTIVLSSILLVAMILCFITISLYFRFMTEVIIIGEVGGDVNANISCPLFIVSFILSLIPLALSIVKIVLNSKQKYIEN